MEERPFLDKDFKPDEQKLQSAFGEIYNYYEKLIGAADTFSQDWNFSKSSGWMLKVHDKKKALFYLIPLKNEFKISMAIRENERKTFLEDIELEMIHDMLKSAKKYREGYALQFDVKNDSYFEITALLIEKLIVLRS
ncbi:DUF3788 family protein [Methanobacterium sp.]|uniref:DUF3788 family protein n=1 Tax=Methanobacterium sp. TaxID=2164 RepID=UPI003C747276